MTDMLIADMAEQKDHEFYIAIVTNDRGESVNQLRFESANKLATITLIGLYIGATISTIYLICCVALLMGVLKNKFKLMYGWVIMDVIGIIVGITCAVYFATPVSYTALGGKIQYCKHIFIKISKKSFFLYNNEKSKKKKTSISRLKLNFFFSLKIHNLFKKNYYEHFDFNIMFRTEFGHIISNTSFNLDLNDFFYYQIEYAIII